MIFVFDLDGTICFKGLPISKQICEALDYCIAKGHEVVFASARPIRDMLPVLPIKYHSFRMVGGNGAFTFEKGHIEVQSFADETVIAIKQLIDSNQLAYLVDSEWDYSYTGDEHHPIYRNLDPERRAVNKPLPELLTISKIVLFTWDNAIRQQLNVLPVKLYEHSQEELVDISPLGIHKGEGLKKLNIMPDNYVAFGNDQNDLELFHDAKYSVCIGNHQVNEYADRIIEQDEVHIAIMELAHSLE